MDEHDDKSVKEHGNHTNDVETTNNGDNVQETEPYTIFTPTQKSLLLYACSISAVFSTISSFIYFPAITAIAKDLGVSIQSINFTITSYQIVSGIAPSILGSMADTIGRRPVLLLTSALYLGANIGLALTKQYAVLVVLRCVQSAGASSSIAIAYGIIADISIPEDRGSFVGIMQGFTNAAPSLGPVIGGAVSQKLSWRWIFWLLAITAGSHLLVLTLLLPETARSVVGNGSVRPDRGINRSVYDLLFRRHTDRPRKMRESRGKLSLLSPLKSLTALCDYANLIVIVVGGITYTVNGCLAASLSAQVIQVYSLNYLTAGLTYLPAGIGGILAAYLTGKMLDHDYRVTTKKLAIQLKPPSTVLGKFPIEKARLRSIFPVVLVSSITTIGYGWTLHARRHIAILLVIQFFSGATQVFVFVTCGTLLTDLNPGRSSTVQASYSLVRCSLSAAGLAALDAMIKGVGVGWCFSILGIFGTMCVPLLYVLKKRGEDWRARKNEKEDNSRVA
jgi:multidrug resistance protein